MSHKLKELRDTPSRKFHIATELKLIQNLSMARAFAPRRAETCRTRGDRRARSRTPA